MTASWRAMMTSWRLPRWPRRFAYPAAGLLLSIGMVAGLLGAPGIDVTPRADHFLDRLRAARAPASPYAYLLVATLVMMTILGWLVGRKEDLLGRLSTTDPLTGLANRRRLRAAFADELNRAARYEYAARVAARRSRSAQGHQRPARPRRRRSGAPARRGERCGAPAAHGFSPPATAGTSSSCSRSTRPPTRPCVLALRIRDSRPATRACARAGGRRPTSRSITPSQSARQT